MPRFDVPRGTDSQPRKVQMRAANDNFVDTFNYVAELDALRVVDL